MCALLARWDRGIWRHQGDADRNWTSGWIRYTDLHRPKGNNMNVINKKYDLSYGVLNSNMAWWSLKDLLNILEINRCFFIWIRIIMMRHCIWGKQTPFIGCCCCCCFFALGNQFLFDCYVAFCVKDNMQVVSFCLSDASSSQSHVLFLVQRKKPFLPQSLSSLWLTWKRKLGRKLRN